eukprot:7965940-Karenia_brevis.AAC.1
MEPAPLSESISAAHLGEPQASISKKVQAGVGIICQGAIVTFGPLGARPACVGKMICGLHGSKVLVCFSECKSCGGDVYSHTDVCNFAEAACVQESPPHRKLADGKFKIFPRVFR